jgi:hypothetical protein
MNRGAGGCGTGKIRYGTDDREYETGERDL